MLSADATDMQVDESAMDLSTTQQQSSRAAGKQPADDRMDIDGANDAHAEQSDADTVPDENVEEDEDEMEPDEEGEDDDDDEGEEDEDGGRLEARPRAPDGDEALDGDSTLR